MSPTVRVSARSATRVLAAALVVVTTSSGLASAHAAQEPPLVYRPPAAGEVVDPFRAPENPYAPGNRGLTYDVAPGSPIRAAADGRVVWAGMVAGSLHVTLLHDDGRRSSYSFLDGIGVVRGQWARAGQLVGTASHGFHFGVREAGRYVDPAALFGDVTIEVRLVPHDEPSPETPAGIAREHRILWELTREKQRGVFDRLSDGASWVIGGAWDLAGDAAGWGYDQIATELDILWERTPISTFLDTVEALWRWSQQECTDAEVVPLPLARRSTAVLVAGYGSSDGRSAIDDVDLAALGYEAGADIRFSYAGGRIPDIDGVLDPALATIASTRYGSAQSMADLWESGRRLADLLEATAAARPGDRIDLFAHSQGGLVTRVALYELERRGALDLLGTVVTIGTPHSGAELASIAKVLSPVLALLIELSTAAVDPDADSTLQMAEKSRFIRALAEGGVPDGVDFRTVGAREDIVVTADKTDVPGHLHATVDLGLVHAHDALPGHAKTTRELQLALAGLPPECDTIGAALLDAAVPEAISLAEDWVGSRLL